MIKSNNHSAFGIMLLYLVVLWFWYLVHFFNHMFQLHILTIRFELEPISNDKWKRNDLNRKYENSATFHNSWKEIRNSWEEIILLLRVHKVMIYGIPVPCSPCVFRITCTDPRSADTKRGRQPKTLFKFSEELYKIVENLVPAFANTENFWMQKYHIVIFLLEYLCLR